jgi:hypothetical protein
MKMYLPTDMNVLKILEILILLALMSNPGHDNKISLFCESVPLLLTVSIWVHLSADENVYYKYHLQIVSTVRVCNTNINKNKNIILIHCFLY